MKVDTSVGRQSNGWYTIACPFARVKHKGGTDRHPGFGVKINNTGSSHYNCFSCGQAGSFYTLPLKLRSIANYNINEQELTLKVLIKELDGVDLDGEIPIKLDERVDLDPLNPHAFNNIFEDVNLYPQGIEYLASRGITQPTIDKLNIKYDPIEDRVVFTIRDQDKSLYGFVGRSIHSDVEPRVKDYWYNKRHFFLGEDLITGNKPILLVEGVFGYASLIENGCDKLFNCLAALGARVTKEKADKLISIGLPVYILFDNDLAGTVGTFGDGGNVKGIANILYDHLIVYTPEWPDDKKDLEELSYKDIDFIKYNCYPYTKH